MRRECTTTELWKDQGNSSSNRGRAIEYSRLGNKKQFLTCGVGERKYMSSKQIYKKLRTGWVMDFDNWKIVVCLLCVKCGHVNWCRAVCLHPSYSTRSSRPRLRATSASAIGFNWEPGVDSRLILN